jgi:hypothetical protein
MLRWRGFRRALPRGAEGDPVDLVSLWFVPPNQIRFVPSNGRRPPEVEVLTAALRRTTTANGSTSARLFTRRS